MGAMGTGRPMYCPMAETLFAKVSRKGLGLKHRHLKVARSFSKVNKMDFLLFMVSRDVLVEYFCPCSRSESYNVHLRLIKESRSNTCVIIDNTVAQCTLKVPYSSNQTE